MHASHGTVVWWKGLIVDTIVGKNDLIMSLDLGALKSNDSLSYIFYEV